MTNEENREKAKIIYKLMCMYDSRYKDKVSFNQFYTKQVFIKIRDNYPDLLRMVSNKVDDSKSKHWKNAKSAPSFFEKFDKDATFEPRESMGNKPYALVKIMNNYHPSGDLVITYPKKEKK